MLLSCACTAQEAKEYADIVSVVASGQDNNYTLSVGISSPDTGCAQYADWWEVITDDGRLIYRRILGHSHIAEQPFVRSGGKVKIGKEDEVLIRAHMNGAGYGGVQFRGSVNEGFQKTKGNKDLALHLEKALPLPSGCAF
jgi:hypothetical protein